MTAAVFTDGAEDTLVAWAASTSAWIRVKNEKGFTVRDLYGTSREIAFDARRTKRCPVPLGQSPIYLTGPKGLEASVRPDPGC